MITFRKVPDSDHYVATHDNGVVVGDIIMEVDGYYVFFPAPYKGGYWESKFLRSIADKLDELNKDWDNIVRREISGGR